MLNLHSEMVRVSSKMSEPSCCRRAGGKAHKHRLTEELMYLYAAFQPILFVVEAITWSDGAFKCSLLAQTLQLVGCKYKLTCMQLSLAKVLMNVLVCLINPGI